MLTTGIQNLPEPLARAQPAYHDGTGRLAPASADRLARRGPSARLVWLVSGSRP